MRIGARVIKTGLAVTFSMYLAALANVQPSVFAAISAIVNLKPSMAQSLKNASQQVTVHVISTVLALLTGYIFGGNPITMGLSTILIIIICLKFKWTESLLMGIVATIFILDAPATGFLSHAVNRSIGIFIGLGVAIMINLLVARPKYTKSLLDAIEQLHRSAVSEFVTAVDDFVKSNPTATIKEIRPLVNRTRELLSQYHDEVHYNRYLRLTTKVDEEQYNLLKHIFEYSTDLLERAEIIKNIVPRHLKENTYSTDIPNSEKYEQILNMLKKVSLTVERLNNKLFPGYLESKSVEPEEIREDFWIELNKLIYEWQYNFEGKYYLQALTEVSLITLDTRWAAREAKHLLFETAKVLGNSRETL